MTILVHDETVPASALAAARTIPVSSPVRTLRDLLRARVRHEVERYNETCPEVFQGLVQPEESEQILHGFRLKVSRTLDWEAQFKRACAAFERNGFLILIDDRQVTELDAPLALDAGSRIQFIKLVPLIGG